MPLKEIKSFCRICIASCATRVQVDEDGHIAAILGDREDPLHRGYACYKGTHAGLSHHSSARVLRPQRRRADGGYEAVGIEDALDEIALRLQPILEEHGPDSLGMFVGNGAFPNSTAVPMHYAFMAAVGSVSRFTTVTIDVGARFIAYERLGMWAGGQPQLEQSDVGLIFGSNGLVSHQAMGIADINPTKRLKAARARGFKLIVVDPRRTETARQADLFLQPYPGQDSAIAAGMVRLILAEGWEDARFCADHVGEARMRDLIAAVAPFTEAEVERRAGLEPGLLRAAAQLFAHDNQRGIATSMTGLAMGPNSNTSVHMLEILNVICGRFLRAGESIQNTNVLLPLRPSYAEVIAPTRSWEAHPDSRIRGFGFLAGERNTGTLADEIMTPGKGQVRALLVNGGNPANSVPDQRKIVRALSSLDLLVSLDPFWSNTARLADFVLPVPLQYERSDIPLMTYEGTYYPRPWSQYTAPVIARPDGSDIVDDWYVYWGLARRLGLSLDYAGHPLDMDAPPTTDALLERLLADSRITLDQLKAQPGGAMFDPPEPVHVMPARPGAIAQFDVMPADVAKELEGVARATVTPGVWQSDGKSFSFLLIVRRWPFIYNTQGSVQPELRQRTPTNSLFVHPADLALLHLTSGDMVDLSSDHASVRVTVEADDTLRQSVVSMSHGWGGLPDESTGEGRGVSVNLLISADRDLEEMNAMPRMTAIPVNIRAAEADSRGYFDPGIDPASAGSYK